MLGGSVRAVLHWLVLPRHQLLQKICDDLRIFVCLLLNFAFSKGVELSEEPHLLQLAD